MSPERTGFEFSNPVHGGTSRGEEDSPLVFMRTPGVAKLDNSCPDSSKRFNTWMDSTSPYTARQTPYTASMKSMAAGGDENTPPVHDNQPQGQVASVGSQQHFHAWLRATSSTSWTPLKSPAAATPPPAPAPSPAATPTSIMRDLQHSAATPPSTSHMLPAALPGHAAGGSRPAAAGDGFDTSDEEEDAGEASTTIGAAQLAAAADRAAAASRMASMRANSSSNGAGPTLQQQHASTPPRVPASSPAVNSAATLDQQQQQAELLQAAADRMVQDSLATPMSQLSISRRPTAQGQHSTACTATTPGMLVDRSLSSGAAALPASPAEKLIGLMMSPGAEGHRRRHHHHHGHQQQQAPSRLSAAMGAGLQAAPVSPNLQVIDLMMQTSAGAHVDNAAAAGRDADVSATGAVQQGGEGASVADPEGDKAATSSYSSSEAGSSSGASGSESDDEMDLSELQALYGDAVGPDTPLSVILGMMLTPEVAGFTPRLAATQPQQAANDDLSPRVLFADD